MSYLEIDCDGLAFEIGGLEVMSLNSHCLELDQSEVHRSGGALMVRFDWGWLAGMFWLSANGPELNIYPRGWLAKPLQVDLSSSRVGRDWLDFDPTDADLADLEAELAVEALFDFEEH